MISIGDLTFDTTDLLAIKSEPLLREWVDPCGAYLMARVVLGAPSLPGSAEQLRQQLEGASEERGRLVTFEALRVAGVSAVVFGVQMAFAPDAVHGVGQTPSYTVTLTLPLMSCSVDINAAYNARLAELAPGSAETPPLDDPPTYLATLMERVASTMELHGSLAIQPPWFADG